MANAPAQVGPYVRAQGTPAFISLLEMQTISGKRYFFSTAPVHLGTLLSEFDLVGSVVTPSSSNFLPRLIDPPAWNFTGTLATSTASATLENLSGDTVQRDGYVMLTRQVLSGALFIYRIWSPALEYALLTVYGNVLDADPDSESFQLSLRGRLNPSAVKAPPDKIGPSCNLTFGTEQCGSTSPVICQNTWGSCTSQNRFKGFVSQWSTGNLSAPTDYYAQPIQIIENNLRRPA